LGYDASINQMPWYNPLLLVVAFCGAAGAAVPAATLDIHAPDSVSGFWGRFFIIEKASRIAGWITSEDKTSDYKITGIHASGETRFRAIVYVPGCALQAVDLAISEPRNYQYSFRCVLIPLTQIQGTVLQPGGALMHDVTVEAKYVANWAPAFFQYDDGTATEIPLGDKATFNGQNKFSLQIPDLAKDKLASSADHPGEIRIYVRDNAVGSVADQLRLTSDNPAVPVSRLGGIPISALSDNGAVLRFCETESLISHDSYGFAVRDDSARPCVP